MNILLIIDNLGAGGAQNQLTLLAVGLKRRGHDVTCFIYHPQDFFESRLRLEEIPVYRADKRDKLGLNVIVSLTRLIRRSAFDIALSYLDTPNFYAAVACRIARRPPVLFVSHRFTTVLGSLGRVQRQIRFWTNRQAQYVVCNSNHERAFWLSIMPQLRAVTIYNGIPDNSETKQLGIDPVTQVPGWPREQAIVLAVGTVTPRKNALLVMKAMEILKSSNKLGFVLVWLGREKRNMHEDITHAEQLHAAIRQKHLEDHWVWAGEQLNTRPFYQSAQVLVHASTEEGLPNAVCEAQMASLPVIVSDVLDHADMIKNGSNGFLFTHDSAASLADKLVEFFTLSDSQRIRMRRQSRQAALQLYSLERCIDDYEELFGVALAD